jgi:hypothetical protein
MKTNTPPASGPLSLLPFHSSATFDLLVSLVTLVLYLETYRSFAPIVPRQSHVRFELFSSIRNYKFVSVHIYDPRTPGFLHGPQSTVPARLMYRRGSTLLHLPLPNRVISISLVQRVHPNTIRPLVFHVRVLYLVLYC